jgi:hypothetical protein
MAIKKDDLARELKSIKEYLEAGKHIAKDKEGQYGVSYAYGWTGSVIETVVLRIENLLKDI